MQKTSDGKIVAQERYASRLPSIVARQDYLSGILPRIDAGGRQNCDRNHGIIMNNIFNSKKTPRNDATTNDRRFSPRSLREFLGDLCGLRSAPDSMRISRRGVRSQMDLYVG
jgi:hypothetical protein